MHPTEGSGKLTAQILKAFSALSSLFPPPRLNHGKAITTNQWNIKEMPKIQRFLNRSELSNIINQKTPIIKTDRCKKMREAVEKHGFSQMEITEHPGMDYAPIIRLIRAK